jgi:hypothetical protein
VRLESPRLYTDENIEAAIVRAVRSMGWDVVCALENHPAGTPDETHFVTAAGLDRILVSHDTDMLAIAARWQAEGRPFAGLLFIPVRKYRDVRTTLRGLRASVADREERSLRNLVTFV